jgi:type IV pilus assembly protein PilW
MIVDGGSPDIPDAFAVNYSSATTIFSPALVISASAGKYLVQSPNGFHPMKAGEKKDLIVAIERPPFSAKGQCASARVDAVTDMSGTCDGCVELAYSGTGLAAAYSVFNLGAVDDAQKVYYDIDAAKGVLRSTRMLDDQGQISGAAPVPLASNVVNMKLQYGVDTDADGLLDTWVSASGNWSPDKLMAAPIATVNQIKAVRIGVVVRSEQFDKNYDQDAKWSMFGGTFSGTYAKPGGVPGNWRYRVYETAIPLRNSIWNKQT